MMTKVFLLLGVFMVISAGIVAALLFPGRLSKNTVLPPESLPAADTINLSTLSRGKEQKENLGKVGKYSLVSSFSINDIDTSNSRFYAASSKPPTLYPVDLYTVSFQSSDQEGQSIEIVSQLFIPQTDGQKELPIYIFGQGTTGLGDNCAPSKERPEVSNWGNYRAHMLSYAASGYIVMFPDYEGFNDQSRIHHYFNGQMEAQVLLDSARATYNFFKQVSLSVKPQQAVFFAGYSQGGHAAFAVKDFASSYAPEIPIKGVIGYGATTDMVALLKENPTLAPYLIYAYADLYGKQVVDSSKILQPRLIPTFETDVLSICIGDIYKRYGYDARQIYSDDFYLALYNDRLDQEFPSFKQLLDVNNSGVSNNDIPSLILQGTTDPIVTLSSQKKFMNKLCKAGNTLTYKEYQGVHHYQTRQVSVNDTLEWMQDILSGKLAQSDCGQI